MTKKVSVAILGSTGYVGVELVKILSRHPNVEIVFIGSENTPNISIKTIDNSINDEKIPLTQLNRDFDYNIADTVLFCVQPGSGDALQFMKAGIVEIPDIITITKSDLGQIAVNTYNDIVNSIKIGNYSKQQDIPIISISSKDDKNIQDLINKIEKHQKNNLKYKNVKKEIRSLFWLEESIKEQFGIIGLKKLKKIKINKDSPFLQFLKFIK